MVIIIDSLGDECLKRSGVIPESKGELCSVSNTHVKKFISNDIRDIFLKQYGACITISNNITLMTSVRITSIDHELNSPLHVLSFKLYYPKNIHKYYNSPLLGDMSIKIYKDLSYDDNNLFISMDLNPEKVNKYYDEIEKKWYSKLAILVDVRMTSKLSENK